MFKALARSAALGAVAAGAGAVAVGFGAFALYDGLKAAGLAPWGSALVVAALFLLTAAVAILATRSGGDAKPGKAVAHAGPGDRLADLRTRAVALAQQRPVVAGAVGLVGALYLLRNPALVTGLVGLLAGRAEGKQEARRGWF